MITRTIEVRANRGKIESTSHDISVMAELLVELKKAGIPVFGALTIRAVTHGKLTIYPEGPDYVYSWTGYIEDDDGGLL